MKKHKIKYLTQMIYRLNEGNGVAYYYLGIDDNGSFYNWNLETKKESLKNLIDIILDINAKIIYILEFNSGYKIKIYSSEFNNNFIF
jgi:GTPase